MSETMIDTQESPTQIVSRLVEISQLDTLFRDLYLQRASKLMETVLSHDSYKYIKESIASLGLAERQLRAAVQRGDWKRSAELNERISSIKRSADMGETLNLAESVYDKLADVPIDRFSSGYYAFFDLTAKGLDQFRIRAVEILSSLEATDPSQKDFYGRRRADFQTLTIDEQTDQPEEQTQEKENVSVVELRERALSAVDSGDLSQLDAVLKLLEHAEKESADEKTAAAEPGEAAATELNEAAALGDDLLYSFPEETLASAKRFGLSKVQTKSRRQFAYLLPYSWHPSFLKSESKRWAKDQLSNLTHQVETSNQMREAIDLYLFNPFITSGGTRYQVCMVVEDLLIEDFDEPEPKAVMPDSELLSALGLKTRWGLTRTEIEVALMEHGPTIVKEHFGLDPEEFRLVVVPTDIFTLLGQDRGWGQKEMWTHFDGYWIRDGGLQALAGGDVRFGGTHDVVSFSPSYSSDKLFVRFAVVQRKRMMTWHKH